ncbi:MAG: tetratricopeptide repeat protein [Flavobacterium sp.]|nr:tetratricopeptide repeat protein [Candidatus Neoflavobacterium equi]
MQINNEEEEHNLSLSKFESMLKTNKILFFDSEEFENIILHYIDTGKTNLAKKALKLGIEQHPHSTGLKLVHVELLIFEDQLETAEKILNELYAIEPTNEEIYIQQANIYSKRDKHEKAVEYLKIALKYTDDFADVYSLLGMEYLFMDNLELAKENFIKCLEVDIDDHSALYNIVYCFDFLDQNSEAVAYLNTYIDKNPYSEVAWHQLGRQHYQLKEFELAVRAFDYATLIDDRFIGAHLEKAKSLEKLKRFDEAIASYEITLELDDPTAYAYLRIGKCHDKNKSHEMALQFYLKAVHEDPQLDKAWICITDHYIQMKNFEKALYYVNKALTIDNENKIYWKRYGAINKALSLFEEAETGYRKAVEYGDFELDTWLFWIDLLQFLGENDSALHTLVNASEYFPDEYDIEYRIAGLNFIKEELEVAEDHLLKALSLSFNNRDVLFELFPNLIDDHLVNRIILNFNNLKNS